jgi:hypothetical protein
MKKMVRLTKIKQGGYKFEVQWECDFDEWILADHPELKTHFIVQHVPWNTRDALYGGRTEAMRLHYMIAEGETIQYVEVMSLYHYICRYFKFPTDHPVIHVGEDCLYMQAMLQKNGLTKCSILLPKHLFHHALPFRCNTGRYSVSVGLVPYRRI